MLYYWHKLKKAYNLENIILEKRQFLRRDWCHKKDKVLGGYVVVITEIQKNFIITAYVSLTVKRGKILWEKQ